MEGHDQGVGESSRRVVERVAARLAAVPVVEAVALGGSRAGAGADARSDVDLYVYARAELPLGVRAELPGPGAARAEIGNAFFEPGDEWVDGATGTRVDVMYRSPAWIEAQLDAVLVEHRASVGYSTCFWWNVRASVPLFDRSGWLARLQERARAPYPEPLRRAVVAKNHPLLRDGLSSYRHQIELALSRDDPVSVQHRTAALLASYFDVLFALNRMPHPGEKRLLDRVAELCRRRPPRLAEDVRGVVRGAGSGDAELPRRVDRLVDGLDDLLRAEGLLG